MGKKVLEFFIRARDGASSVLHSIGSTLSRVGQGFKSLAVGALKNLANIKAGFDMLKSAAQTVASGLRKIWDTVVAAMQYEALEKKWAMLLHDADRAKALVKELNAMGETPPFSREQFSQAAQALNTFGGQALVSTDLLKDMGDTAYRTGNSVEAVAEVIGRCYSVIRDGQPLERMKMQLQRMGIVTPEVAAKLGEMTKNGASAAEQWDILRNALRQSQGAMDSALQTGDGLMKSLQGSWASAVQEFGAAFLDLAKTELKYFLDRLKELREDGSIQKWAEKAREAIQPLVEIFGNLLDGESRSVSLDAAWDKLKSVLVWAWDSLKNVLEYGGKLIYSNIKDAISPFFDKESFERDARGLYDYKQSAINAQFRATNQLADARIEKAAEDRRERAAKRAAEAESRNADKEAEKKKRADEERAREEEARRNIEEAERRRQEEAANKQRMLDEAEARKKQIEEEKRQNDQVIDKLKNGENPFAPQLQQAAKLNADAVFKAAHEDKKFVMADVDAAVENEKDAIKRKREEDKFEKRLAEARKREELAGDRSKLSKRDRAILELDDKRKREKEEAKKNWQEIQQFHQQLLNDLNAAQVRDDQIKQQLADAISGINAISKVDMGANET